MSYATRVYRQRNAHVHENEPNKGQEAFFSKSSDPNSHKGSRPGSFFQAKLSIGQPNDSYEKEADAVAGAVVSKQPNHGTPVVQRRNISSIQRYATPIDEDQFSTNDERMKHDKEIQEKPEIQAKCAACEKEEEGKKAPVQKKAEGGGAASPNLSAKIKSASAKGNQLPQKTLVEMSHAFGVDFSNVKIHTDSESVQMNKELGAQAFTHRNHVFFNAGKYKPGSEGGKHLLAHELTHVVQQQSSDSIQRFAMPGIQAACEDKSVKNCGGICTHPTSGNAGQCRWTGLTNGCKCFENPRSGRSLMEVLPYWIIALLSAAAIAALAACFASGACEAGIIIGAAGAAVGAIIIGIFRAAGVQVAGDAATNEPGNETA